MAGLHGSIEDKECMMGVQVKDRLLNVQQVRSRLECSRSHVYNLINQGEIPAIRIGVRQGIRVRESEVDRFLEAHEVEECPL